MNRDNADAYYYFNQDYYETLFNGLEDNAFIFNATKDGIVIASSIILKSNNLLSYHLSGSLREYGYFAPTNLLLWEVCKWGISQHCSTLHLGGGVGGTDDGLFHFKKSFYKGEPTSFFIGKKIFNQKAYDELVAMKSNIERSNYFPKYRG